jgi:hypothetical protein
MKIGNGYTSLRRDNYNTPIEAWDLILSQMKEIPKGIWCPFFNDGSLTKMLKKRNISIIHKNKDFFTYEPDNWSVIIDNIPFSIKNKVFERCKNLGKPFACLVPIDTLERKYFQNLFKDDKKLQIIIPNKRYNYEGYDNNNNVPFKSIWVCYKMNLKTKNQIIFEGL